MVNFIKNQNSKFLILSLVVAIGLISFSLFYFHNAVGSFTVPPSGLNGHIVTESLPSFGCDIGPVCGASCDGTFRSSGSGSSWSVSGGFKKINLTNHDSTHPSIQTLSVALSRVDVDDDGQGTGWHKDTCRGGGGPFCSNQTGNNCAETIFPDTTIWTASAGDDR